MTRSLLWIGLLFCAMECAAQNAPPRSPEVGADRRVTFRLRAPAAREVAVAGEFQKGSTLLQKSEDGVWSVTIGPIDPEIYNYSFTVDGVRTIDPGNPEVKTGSTPSTIASILEVRADKPAFYDAQNVPHGEVRTHWYNSKSLGAIRRLTVYTPPDYNRGARRYPVLYLFHGANADETAWTRLGRVNLILDNLLHAGEIQPFVVVMPFGYGAPPGSATSTPNGVLFERDLLGDVIPFIDSHYRTRADREHRAIAGLSMGAGQSLSIGLNHLELFSKVAGFSPAIPPRELDKTFAKVRSDPQAANRIAPLLWVGCGTDDNLFSDAEGFSKFLDSAGMKHVFRKTGGAHTWMVWRRYLKEFAPLAFGIQKATQHDLH